ncbi:PREDICTED: ankyrin repeat domain-containing protein SOWAHA [Pygoscelis adeliae]|uniref:ankyrin repeat domain-containing protein SOWAHA n=1 Tax=Pygoscelis adeliae TaxID=9238 RepID=UPI0004F4EBA8|nr:PREDICTED: ankyrin repeat domain-containing protein SOWAHA [Pygoscelis adeliae]
MLNSYLSPTLRLKAPAPPHMPASESTQLLSLEPKELPLHLQTGGHRLPFVSTSDIRGGVTKRSPYRFRHQTKHRGLGAFQPAVPSGARWNGLRDSHAASPSAQKSLTFECDRRSARSILCRIRRMRAGGADKQNAFAFSNASRRKQLIGSWKRSKSMKRLPLPEESPKSRYTRDLTHTRLLSHLKETLAQQGERGPLHGLLLGDASLAARRDFISGFTALHWAAKSGNCDMVTNIIRAAEKGGARINVDARSHGGYTALHLAAIHGQEKIITMLVYSYHAKTDLRDYSGKKPHQYLKEGASSAVRRLLGDPSLPHNVEPSVPIKKTTKLAASILSSTSTFLGVISDDMAFYDLTKGLRKPSSLNKLLAATTGPRKKPKTRGGFPSYSSLSEVMEEEEEEVVVKRRPVSELFFGH